ncbi:MAG: SCO family protein [Candidatus Puniceispirillaceae bacterium]
MTTRTRRQLLIFAIGLLALTGGIVGDRYLRDTKPALFPSLSDISFTLQSHDGSAITSRDFIGKPTAIYFGFTWCPDICPTTLSQMADMKSELGADSLQLVFFTVDPERDTPEQLADYVSLFDGDITGITGTPDKISEAIRRFGVFAQKIPDEEGDEDSYMVDHTASVYLYDEAGSFFGTISPAEPYDMALAKMARLTQKNNKR